MNVSFGKLYPMASGVFWSAMLHAGCFERCDVCQVVGLWQNCDCVHCLSHLVTLQTSRMGLTLVMLCGRMGESLHPVLHFPHEVEACKKQAWVKVQVRSGEKEEQ